MHHWLILADWIVAVVFGVPSALVMAALGAFYLLRPQDAKFAGLAGYAVLFCALLGLGFAGLFALAAWGGARNAEWAPYVQVIALLCGLLPVMLARRRRASN